MLQYAIIDHLVTVGMSVHTHKLSLGSGLIESRVFVVSGLSEDPDRVK